MLERARVEATARVVRASIRPDNEASRALVAQFGFVEVGEQWDDEDGLELLFDLAMPSDA
jgi:L-amino acid N-acyltransferase YncA